jgi:glycosyltransferase involved in cell wall biosynthesis
MRVLMISDFYPPHIGGTELQVQMLSRELARRGHRVAVATTGYGDALSFEIDQGVRVYRSLAGWNRALAPLYENREHLYHPPLPDPGIMAGLQRIVARERPDIVHAHGLSVYSFIGLKAWSKAKLVVTLHNYGLVCPMTTYLNNGQPCTGPAYTKCIRCVRSVHGAAKAVLLTNGLRVSSYLHRYVDQFIAVSSDVRDASSAGAGHISKPIVVAPNFIPDGLAEEAYRAERPDFLPPTDGYILYVGRQSNHAHKGLDVLLEAYEGLTDPPPLVALIADYGRAPARMPEGVIVARNVPHSQVMAAWAHCGLGVVPSVVVEAFGIVAVEAMACGKPVIASAIGGLREVVVDGETGVLVAPGDANALRQALQGLLADPARRARLGAAGRRRARVFSASSVTNKIEEIYSGVLSQNQEVPAWQV